MAVHYQKHRYYCDDTGKPYLSVYYLQIIQLENLFVQLTLTRCLINKKRINRLVIFFFTFKCAILPFHCCLPKFFTCQLHWEGTTCNEDSCYSPKSNSARVTTNLQESIVHWQRCDPSPASHHKQSEEPSHRHHHQPQNIVLDEFFLLYGYQVPILVVYQHLLVSF